MKLAVATLMVASAQAETRRDLFYTHQNTSVLPTPRTPNVNCTAGTVANLLTAPVGCVSSKLLGPLVAAGFDISASSLSGTAAATAYGTDYIYNLTAIADGVPGVQAAIAAVTALYNVNISRSSSGLDQYNGNGVNTFNSSQRAQFNYAYAKAACAAIKPVLESGAACVKSACRDTVLNICDGDNQTDGYDSQVGGYITSLSKIAKLWCTRDMLSFNPLTTWPTCESFFPAAAFGTYVAPTTNSSSNTTAPASAASSVEVGMLAAASVVVAALAF